MAEKGAEKELETLISEYLTSRGCLQTVASFQTESSQRPKLATPTQTTGLQSDLLESYEEGDRDKFFNLWNQNVPESVLANDRICHNLEFNISVYFAVYPIRTGRGEKTSSLQQFSSYLSKRSSVLSDNPELSVYCALPYVPDLLSHPVFKQLFTESWNSELKSRLIHFLKLSLTDTRSQPKLLSLYLSNKVTLTTAGSLQEVVVLRDQLSECHKHYSHKISEIQDSYHTLVGIALELLDSLESAIAGHQVTPESIQSICSRLFGGSLSDTVAIGDIRPGTATSILRQSVISMRDHIQVPATLHTSTPIPESLSSDNTLTSPPTPDLTMSSSQTTPTPRNQLDYMRLKSSLALGNQKEKRTALIIQALRWRLTKAQSPETSLDALKDYIINDLLGCSDSTHPYHEKVVDMLEDPFSLVCEQLCRLLNTVSSFPSGRSYLSLNHHLMAALCRVLVIRRREEEREKEEDEEEDEEEEWGVEGTITKNALGAIQKLSLKRDLQALMIDNGMPQWVAMVIAREDSPSDFILRYSLALLMNLALRTAGKWACLEVGSSLLRSLGDLLEHEDEEICSYVNGILYSLLSLSELRQEARGMGMGDMLTSALEASPPELKSQIHYIILKLDSTSSSSETDPDVSDDDKEEDEEDGDGDVIEGDEDEVAIATSGPVGESLLIQYEMKRGEEKRKKKKSMSNEVPFKRPVKPQHTSRPISKAKSATTGDTEEMEYGKKGGRGGGGGGGGGGDRVSARSN